MMILMLLARNYMLREIHFINKHLFLHRNKKIVPLYRQIIKT
jgi:hypothetical protein